jgi:diguanylate cyclase (GGDEF)-like protein
MLYALVAGLLVGLARGGRLGGLAQLQFRWAPVAVLGLAIQVVLFSPPVTRVVGDAGSPLYVGSTLLVLAVVASNVRVSPALALVVLGGAANLAAIAANGGFMPATPDALLASGHAVGSGFSNSVTTSDALLAPLVDRFAIPAGWPLSNVFSVGDVLVGVGIGTTIVGAMGATLGVRRVVAAAIAAAGRATSPRVRVAAFSLLLAVAGVAGLVLLFPTLQPQTAAPLDIPWPLFAIAYAIAEVKVIDVHFRRETHSFSLTEVPVVLGLFFVDPRFYILGLTCGAVAALVTVRQPAPKVFFNLAYFLLGSVLSLATFQAIAPVSGPPAALDWVAAFAATLVNSTVGAVAIAVVISLSGSSPQLDRLPQMLQVGALFAVTNTSLALLAVAILWVDPMAIWLVAVPLATLFLAYRAYLSERQKHASLEMLYESSRIFLRSAELDSAIVSLLEHARLMFHSDRAEIVVAGPEGTPLRTAVGPGRASAVMVPVPERAEVLARLSADGGPFIYAPGEDVPTSSDRLFRYAMVAPLRGESGLLGAIVVSDRIGESDEFTRDELRLLETVANQAAVALENGRLEQSLSELFRLKEELRHQAYHDPLTGLANRALFLDAVRARLDAPASARRPVILFLDLDDFKVVNDTVGHGLGDVLLQTVARRLTSCVRDADTVARLGGDEFAILTEDDVDLVEARQIAERVTDSFRAPFHVGERDFVIRASLGIAAGAAGQTADELLRNADVAMYDAKVRGKAQVSLWTQSMHRAVVERHEMSADLSRAVDQGELDVFYQPLVALDTGRIVGFEALSRWNHPTRGPVPPDQFIALAEQSDTIVTLGRRVLRQACRDAVAWRSMPGLEDASVSVNLSPHQVARADFNDDVAAILAETRLDPAGLVLEMTETAMFRDMDGAVLELQSLRSTGIRLAVDDFGTGYSSLRYLRQFRVDELKIARDFIASEEDDDDGWAFAHAIVVLGRTLGLAIVAEGVETQGQRERLRELGCDIGQGYLFSRPVPAYAVASLVARLSPTEGDATPSSGPVTERASRRRSAGLPSVAPSA